jgi:predicted DNA-binding protein with PD1-like motif
MQYAQGELGRVFFLRFDHGEDLLHMMQEFLVEHEVRTGIFHILGALREGMVVTGPLEPVVPPTPREAWFEGGWEVLGTGTILPGEGGRPMVHIHSTVGRGTEAFTGCLRKTALVYLVVEAVVIEITAPGVERRVDEKLGVHVPWLGQDPGQ